MCLLYSSAQSEFGKGGMLARGIHHVDLAVRDVERSLAFYLAVLGPFGLREASRDPSYRGTEEVVYLRYGDQLLGLRSADGGEYRYYAVGIEHLAFYVDSRAEVDAAYQRCLEIGARIHFPPEGTEHKYELFVFDPDGIRVEVGYAPHDISF
jgi:glyoxylase I family protein